MSQPVISGVLIATIVIYYTEKKITTRTFSPGWRYFLLPLPLSPYSMAQVGRLLTRHQKDESCLVTRKGDQRLGTVVSFWPDVDAIKLVAGHQEGGLLLHKREVDSDSLVL